MFLENTNPIISIVYHPEVNHSLIMPFWAVTFGLSPVFPKNTRYMQEIFIKELENHHLGSLG